MIERIHHGDDFVNIHTMGEDDESGNALTGGYMFKIDKSDAGDGSDPVFWTETAPYTMIYPEDEAVTTAKVILRFLICITDIKYRLVIFRTI